MPISLSLLKGQKIYSQYGDLDDCLIFTSDQILVFDGKILSKVNSDECVRERLNILKGKDHLLISSISVFFNKNPIFSFKDKAVMKMKNFSDSHLQDYMNYHGSSLKDSVGCYKFEDTHYNLFDQVYGCFFTILGLPIIRFFDFLKKDKI